MNRIDRTATQSTSAWVLAVGLTLASIGLAQPQATEALPVTQAGSSSDSNNRMIAVTGVDLTGSSVLYLVDTVNQRLAVYQATGGAASTQGIKLIGARRIDLDLRLHGLNDRSEYTFKDLAEQFTSQGLPVDDPAGPMGAPSGGR